MSARGSKDTTHLGPKVSVQSPEGERHVDVPLTGDRVTVGRRVPGYEPDIVLGPDPQAWISRLHCWFEQVEGSWWLVDNGSVNGTVVERQGERRAVDGRTRLQHGDGVLVLGYLVDDEPYFWRLQFSDPFATAPASVEGPAASTATADPAGRSHLEYRIEEAKLFVVDDNRRTEVSDLGPNLHKLVRYMTSRNAANAGAPVACSHDELITAVWGDPSTWRYRAAYTSDNLRDLVFELRKKLRPHSELIETIKGVGYSLRTRPSGS